MFCIIQTHGIQRLLRQIFEMSDNILLQQYFPCGATWKRKSGLGKRKRLKRDKLASPSVVISQKKKKKEWKGRKDRRKGEIKWIEIGVASLVAWGLHFPDLTCTAHSLSIFHSLKTHTYCPSPVLLLLRAASQHLKLSDKGGVTVTFNLWPWGHRLSVILTSGSESHCTVSPPKTWSLSGELWHVTSTVP